MTVNTQTGDASGDLIDPGGIPAGEPVQPAPRLPGLEGRRLLLLDNGKLGVGVGPYAAIADTLRNSLPEAIWTKTTINLLRADDADIEGIADSLIATHRPEACILALADAGVTAHTALLSMALERRGAPTVILGTPLGAGLGRAMFRTRAPGLEMVVLNIVRTDNQEKAVALIAAEVPRIRELLACEVAPKAAERVAAYPAEAARRWAGAARDMASFQDWAEQAGIGDGLPLIPPTAAAVAAHLATVEADADALVYGPALTSGRVLRARDVAANAAMAGCPPRSFPVVLAALRAMAKPGYRLSQAAITTHPSGNAIILSGGDPAAYGLSAGPGCLGPGHRGNACVGRAVSLSVLHLFGARPGEADLTIFGSPAEFTYCAAETHSGTPWPSLATTLGDGKAGVFVLKAEAPRNVLENLALTPEALSGAIAEASVSLCSNNSFIPGELLVFLNPEHAMVFGDAGWTRNDVACAIHNLAWVRSGHAIWTRLSNCR